MGKSKPQKTPAGLWGALLILGVGFAIYANSLKNDFVLDDFQVVVSNPLVTGEGSIVDVFKSDYWAHRFASDLYRPLSILSLRIDYLLWGLEPAGYRFTNIALHALTSLLAYAALLLLLRSRAAALLGALLYACHPIHVEAVVPAVGRSECLSGALIAAALLLYLRNAGKGSAWGLGLSMLSFFLATLSKESALVFPLVLVALELVFPTGDRKARYFRLLPYAGAAAASFGLRVWMLGANAIGGAPVAFIDNPAAGLGFTGRLLTAVEVTARYLKLLVFPAVLSADYSYAQVRPVETPWSAEFLAAAATLLLAAAAAVGLRRRAPEVSFGLLWFAVTYVPASNVLIPTGAIMAERLMHVPSLGLCLAAGGLAGRLWERRVQSGRALAGIAAAALVGIFGVRTIVRNADFRDNATLFAATVKTSPDSVRMRLFYGDHLSKSGEFKEAQAHFDAAAALLPDYGPTQLFLGGHLGRMGRYEEAVVRLRRAAELNPDLPDARQGLGNALRMAGRIQESLQELEIASKLKPQDPEIWCNLGQSLVMAGQPDQAEEAFRQALGRQPSMPAAHLGLAWAYETQRRYADALREYEKVRSVDPQNYEAALGLAGILKAMGRMEDAVRAYWQALKLRPGDLVGIQELAVLLAEMGRIGEAIEAFQAAVRFNPSSVTALNNLGRAYWIQGDAERARASFRRALEIDPSNAFAQQSLQALQPPGRP